MADDDIFLVVEFDAICLDDDSDTFVAPLKLSDSKMNPLQLVESDEFKKNTLDRLYLALNKLDIRSREIVEKRYLQEEKATLSELSDAYGVSIERVRQLEVNALNKLRAFMCLLHTL